MKTLIIAIMFSTVSIAQGDYLDQEFEGRYGGLLEYSIPSRKLYQPWGGYSLPTGTYSSFFWYMTTSNQLDTAYIVSRTFSREGDGTSIDEFVSEANTVLSGINVDYTVSREIIMEHISSRDNLVFIKKDHNKYNLIAVVIDGKDLVLEIHKNRSLK